MRPLALALQALIVLLWLGGCASGPVSQAEGDSAWVKRINETWLPQTARAIDSFKHIAKTELGASLDTAPRILLSSTDAEFKQLKAAQAEATIVLFDSKQSSLSHSAQAVNVGVGAYMLALQKQLSAGQYNKIPIWLRSGAADTMSARIQDQFNPALGTAQALREAQQELRDKSKNIISAQDLFLANAGLEKRQGVASMSRLLFAQLVDVSNTPFWSHYAAYLRKAALADYEAGAAFEASFGIAQSDFLAGAQAKIRAITEEQRGHRSTLPPASGYARIEELDRYPLTGEAARKLYERYRKAASPKALAFSPRGQSSFQFDNPDAIDTALARCALMDPLGCRLYAVDDIVVYQEPKAENTQVQVLWGSGEQGSWNKEVRQKWFPLTQAAVAAYNKLMLARTGTGLSINARIYVSASENDYEQVLRDNLKLLKDAASKRAESSRGISNGDGSTAILLREKHAFDTEELRTIAIKTPLHELTHELQSQLARNSQGRGLVWLREGTADLFAYSVAQEMQLDNAADITKAAWQQNNIAWYKRGGWQVSATDLWTANYADWLKMSGQNRGPYQMAGLMSAHLESLLGEQFTPAWLAYFKGLADKDKTLDGAFEESFGISREAFLADFNAWLKTLWDLKPS